MTEPSITSEVAPARTPATVGDQPAAVVVAPRPSLPEILRDAWHDRQVVRGLAAQIATAHFAGSILGVWWIPIMIVFNAVATGFIFGTVLTVPSAEGIPYYLFAAVGTMTWWGFSRGALFSLRSFHRFRHYVTTLSFPLVLVPVASLMQVLVELGFYAVFVAGVFAVFWAIDGELYLNLSPELLLVPVGFAWLLLFAAIVGLFAGPVYFRARDVRQVYRLLLPFWMFVTPIVYPLSKLEGTLGVIARLNPLAPPVELVKVGLFGTGGVPAYSIASGVAVTLVLLAGGLLFASHHSLALLSWSPEVPDEDV